ncbi:MAG: TrkA C-terminal domain-containing protein [Verrucomicrobiota bacterium]
MEEILSNPLVALFAIIGLGLILGSIKVWGLSLGSSGVLFVGLVFGHFGYGIPPIIGTIGLVIFVYCVGIGAGGRFFNSLKQHGVNFALLSVVVVAVAAGATWILARMADLPTDLATGIFAGALTSTPALAAGLESIPAEESLISIGYSIAYPFGVVGVVVMVQLLPRLMRVDLAELGKKLDQEDPEQREVGSRLVRVTNPNLFGQKISEKNFFAATSCTISRVLENDRLRPLRYDDIFEQNGLVMLVGFEDKVMHAVDFIGRVEERYLPLDADRERRQLVLTSAAAAGKALRSLETLKQYGVVITRIRRGDVTFAPTGDTVVESGDVLQTVGQPEDLEKFAGFIGHRSQADFETDILSFAVGITLGVLLGLLPFGGGEQPFTLGLAGGPLFVGLVLGHFGRIGRIAGFIPRPTRLLLSELGLVMFLAAAGTRGGGAFVATVEQYGLVVFAVGAVVTALPLLIAVPLAQWVWRLNLLQALGGVCGGMTSTPALGTITAKTDSQVPVVSYATAYPVALILMIVLTKGLVQVLGVPQ